MRNLRLLKLFPLCGDPLASYRELQVKLFEAFRQRNEWGNLLLTNVCMQRDICVIKPLYEIVRFRYMRQVNHIPIFIFR